MDGKKKNASVYTEMVFPFFPLTFLNELRSHFRMSTATAKYIKLILFLLLAATVFTSIQFKVPLGLFNKSMGFIDPKFVQFVAALSPAKAFDSWPQFVSLSQQIQLAMAAENPSTWLPAEARSNNCRNYSNYNNGCNNTTTTTFRPSITDCRNSVQTNDEPENPGHVFIRLRYKHMIDLQAIVSVATEVKGSKFDQLLILWLDLYTEKNNGFLASLS